MSIKSDTKKRARTQQKLSIAEVPPVNSDWNTISQFALKFDAYKYWGSFKKCAQIANTRKQDTLTELLTCLFFEQRRHHHFGEAPDKEQMRYIRDLLKKIRFKVRTGEP